MGSRAGDVDHPAEPAELSLHANVREPSARAAKWKQRLSLPAIAEAMRRLYGALPRGDSYRPHTRPDQIGEGRYKLGICYGLRCKRETSVPADPTEGMYNACIMSPATHKLEGLYVQAIKEIW